MGLTGEGCISVPQPRRCIAKHCCQGREGGCLAILSREMEEEWEKNGEMMERERRSGRRSGQGGNRRRRKEIDLDEIQWVDDAALGGRRESVRG